MNGAPNPTQKKPVTITSDNGNTTAKKVRESTSTIKWESKSKAIAKKMNSSLTNQNEKLSSSHSI